MVFFLLRATYILHVGVYTMVLILVISTRIFLSLLLAKLTTCGILSSILAFS